MKRALTWVISAPMLALIGLYKYVLSPLTPPSCRHYPTCSTYAGEAIREWGPWTGSWLSLRRLSRCHPWGTSGIDPVPKKSEIAPRG
ncbi:MAG: rane protein insertion efficiency factor YidD [Bacteroidota bacterium]|jgi:putative membrane protein insertion efficiency factor